MNLIDPSNFKDSNPTYNYPVNSKNFNFPGMNSNYIIEDKILFNQEMERKNHNYVDNKKMSVSIKEEKELLSPRSNEKYNGIVGRFHFT